MEIQEIEVIIDKDGKVQIHVNGVKGTACLDLTKALEQALGGHVESREMTSDAYDTTSEEISNQQKLRG